MKESYLDRNVTSIDPKRFRDLLLEAEGMPLRPVSAGMQGFLPYIKQRRVMQWGGMSDPFDEYERKYGISLEMLQLFDRHDYPLSISTKGTWWIHDERYMELVRRHARNWHFKLSIITNNAYKARMIERGVDSPKKRLEVIRMLAEAGCHVTLRLRPYILGVSEDWKELISAGAAAGADSVTTEFFCLENRAGPELKQRYRMMSKVCGFDVHEYYRHNSTRAGYYRLNYQLKIPIVTAMRDHVHSLKMRFYVSDADHKAKSDFTCCCGCPPQWNVSKGQFTEALMIAKKRAREGLDPTMHWSDISEDAEALIGGIDAPSSHGTQVARSSTLLRARYHGYSLADWMRAQWNNPKSGFSPAKYFGEPVKAVGIDSNGDVVYELSMKHVRMKQPVQGR